MLSAKKNYFTDIQQFTKKIYKILLLSAKRSERKSQGWSEKKLKNDFIKLKAAFM